MKKSIAFVSALAVSVMASAAFLSCSSTKSNRNAAAGKNQEVVKIRLNNGTEIPQLGIGTYLSDDETAYNAVLLALKTGFRHIDTAHAYQNERGIARAVKESGIPRSEIWITSKLWPTDYSSGNGAESIDRMLERLGTDYVDLVYLHQPVGDYMAGYRALENAVRQGKVRAIGLSNFDLNESLFDEVIAKAEIKPSIVQIELHPYAQRKSFRQKCAENNLAVEGWFPLGGSGTGNETLFDAATIKSLAEKYGKSPAQIILRWHVQEGFCTIPGMREPAHIAENIQVYGFSLSDEDMEKMRSLDKERRFFTGTYESAQDYANWTIDY